MKNVLLVVEVLAVGFLICLVGIGGTSLIVNVASLAGSVVAVSVCMILMYAYLHRRLSTKKSPE